MEIITSEIFLISIFVLVIGACIGSFLNVAALRKISGESIVLPPSKCPLCGEHIKWYDNIPIFSYFFTIKGKCRNCGGKVSVQYPIVEFITALLFLAVFIAYGFTIKTLLLLILISLSIVITITDIKKNEIYDVHNWSLIIMSIITGLYLKGINNYYDVAIGLIAGVFVMEAIARLSFYLVKKNDSKSNKEETTKDEYSTLEKTNEEKEYDENCNAGSENIGNDFDIKAYMEKNKRAFGEGDTYLAAASGALLGWKYLLVAIPLAIIIQAVCVFPQFVTALYKQKEYKLLISLSVFIFLSLVYWIISNIFTLNFYTILILIAALLYFGADSIIGLKKTNNNQCYKVIPFGPALLFATFLIFFFGIYVMGFLKQYIFMS